MQHFGCDDQVAMVQEKEKKQSLELDSLLTKREKLVKQNKNKRKRRKYEDIDGIQSLLDKENLKTKHKNYLQRIFNLSNFNSTLKSSRDDIKKWFEVEIKKDHDDDDDDDDEDDDSDIKFVIPYVSISLRDCFTFKRIQIPAKGAECNHRDYFDLVTFLDKILEGMMLAENLGKFLKILERFYKIVENLWKILEKFLKNSRKFMEDSTKFLKILENS